MHQEIREAAQPQTQLVARQKMRAERAASKLSTRC